MLLNQCLAISLSPQLAETGRPAAAEARTSRESALRLLSQLVEENREQDLAKTEVARIKSKPMEAEEELETPGAGSASASTTTAVVLEDSIRTTTTTINEQQQRIRLAESLARLELAGFVLPGWLLVSGSLGDLERVRSSWFTGLIKAPPGFRLETIGK